MAIKILQIDLQNDITPQIGSYDNAGGVTPNTWFNDYGVYSLGPTNTDGTTPYYWFTPTKEVADFDLCWEDYQDHEQTTPQYHLEIGDSAGNVVLSVLRQHANYYIGPVSVGNLAYQTWHKILVEVRKASASSSTVTVYVDGRKVAVDTSNTLLTSAKIALLGHVPNIFYMQNAGQRLRYVTIYDRSYASKGINLDGMMTIITGLFSKFISKLSTVAFTGSYNDLSNKPTISTVNDGTLTIQKNGANVQTFTANQSTNATANITVPTKTSDLTNDSGFITSDNTKIPLAGSNQISGSLIPSTDNSIDIGSSTKNIKVLYTKGITIDGTQFLPSDYLPKTTALESLSTNSIPFHNAYPRCKYLGTSITDAQNTAIKNRTYDDLFVGDYWTINGINWRIVAIDYYFNVSDTNFSKGNIIVMPDTVLYNAQMNSTDTTAGAYYGSLMRTQNLNSARTIAQNAFGSHLANHRIMLANAVDASGPSGWAWYDSDGVELPNEVQIYGTRAWSSALKGWDVATQKQQFPLMLFAPQFVNTKQGYWLQDVSSISVSSYFARVTYAGNAHATLASNSAGVRPSVTLSFI